MSASVVTDVVIFIAEPPGKWISAFGEESLPRYLRTFMDNFSFVRTVYIALPESCSGSLSQEENIIQHRGKDDVTFWKKVLEKSDADHFIKIDGDSYFCDRSIITEMHELHVKYLAESTYSENLPRGYSCEIFSRELLDQLPAFDKETLPLIKIIKDNINQFDIELYYRDPDMRDKRLTFSASDPRQHRVMEEMLAIHGRIPLYDELLPLINNHPELLHTAPAFLELEINGACDLNCIFCYRSKTLHEPEVMALETVKKILDDMKEFGLPYTVCLGGSGEPLEHPHFYALVDTILADDLVERLVIETNGHRADGNYTAMLEKKAASKIITIINLNGVDEQTYEKLHGTAGYDRVTANIERITRAETESQLFVQLLKINETEEFTDTYYDIWEKQKIPVIFQKQNTWIGAVEDRRYSDLSPLVRSHCWHLLRDLYITAQGNAAYCKQDFSAVAADDSCLKKTISQIWLERRKAVIDHYSGKVPSNPDCQKCDEWYTFNY